MRPMSYKMETKKVVLSHYLTYIHGIQIVQLEKYLVGNQSGWPFFHGSSRLD